MLKEDSSRPCDACGNLLAVAIGTVQNVTFSSPTTPTPEPRIGLFLPTEALFGIGAIIATAVLIIVIALRKRK